MFDDGLPESNAHAGHGVVHWLASGYLDATTTEQEATVRCWTTSTVNVIRQRLHAPLRAVVVVRGLAGRPARLREDVCRDTTGVPVCGTRST